MIIVCLSEMSVNCCILQPFQSGDAHEKDEYAGKSGRNTKHRSKLSIP